jgi:hypothetical protein
VICLHIGQIFRKKETSHGKAPNYILFGRLDGLATSLMMTMNGIAVVDQGMMKRRRRRRTST